MSTTVSKNPLEEVISHHSQQKNPKCSTWMQSQKWQNDPCSFSRQAIQYHNNPSLCPNQWCLRSWSWMILWRHIKPFITNTPKRCPFHYRGMESKSRKSRNTWSNRQIWPWSREWSRAKADRVLPRECTGHSKHPSNNTRGLYTWTSPDGWHQNQIDCILCSQRWRNSIQSAKARPGADCGSDHELLIAKFRLKLKKVGKTTRSFSYDLNQIPFCYLYFTLGQISCHIPDPWTLQFNQVSSS